jgi:hypothetical protein
MVALTAAKQAGVTTWTIWGLAILLLIPINELHLKTKYYAVISRETIPKSTTVAPSHDRAYKEQYL